jgi:lipopolysaccharide export system permease protein
MVLATLPFAFTALRSGGLGKRLFMGIVISIGYLLAERLFVSLADVYRFEVWIGYLAPPVILVSICWGWLGRRL